MQVEFGISEYFFKLTRQLGECFFPSLSESVFPADDDDDDDGRFLACEDCGKVRALVRYT
jgi:hypothetical protein